MRTWGGATTDPSATTTENLETVTMLGDPMDEYLTGVREEWEHRLEHVDVDFVCVGHTHMPMNLQLNSTQVINPGSVGQPRDGDARASYAIIEDGQVEFRRVEYDIDRTLHHMQQCGIEQSIIRKAATILRSGGNPEAKGVSSI